MAPLSLAWLLSFAFASCDNHLKNSVFSEHVIAESIGQFHVLSERLVFVDLLSGMKFLDIAKKHRVDIKYVVWVAERGHDILLETHAKLPR